MAARGKSADKGDRCELKLTWASALKKSNKVDKSAMLEIEYVSKNTIEEIALFLRFVV